LQELLRVLKPRAEAMITVWNKEQKRFRDKGKEVYVPWKTPEGRVLRYYYLYDKQELKQDLLSSGFEIIEIVANGEGYAKYNIIAIVRKPKTNVKNKS